MEFRKLKKEMAKAARAQEKITKETMEMKDVLWKAIETYENSQNLNTSDARISCIIPVPNLIENWFAHGHSVSFIPNKYRETNGKLRNLSNLEWEIDSAVRDVKNGYARKVVFTWTNVEADENGKINSENVVMAYYKGKNPTLKIHFVFEAYRGTRYGISDETNDTPEMKDIIPFSFE